MFSPLEKYPGTSIIVVGDFFLEFKHRFSWSLHRKRTKKTINRIPNESTSPTPSATGRFVGVGVESNVVVERLVVDDGIADEDGETELVVLVGVLLVETVQNLYLN